MKKLTLLALFFATCLFACASPYEDVFALRGIHRPLKKDEACVNKPAHGFFRFREAVPEEPGGDPEEVEDPVSFCLDRIENLSGFAFEPDRSGAAIVSVLCFTAERSPSALVRAAALKALGKLLDGLEPPAEEPPPREKGAEKPQDLEKEWKTLLSSLPGGAEDLPPGLRAEMDALLGSFAAVSFSSAREAWETLSLFSGENGFLEEDPALRKALASAVTAVAGRAFLLTLKDALFDTSPIVVREAVDALIPFPARDIMPSLARLMAGCYDPLLRVHVLEALEERGLKPVDLGGEMMTQVRRSLDFTDAGVVYHAVELFKALTGMENDDPGFWKKWWSRYLTEHADELSEKS